MRIKKFCNPHHFVALFLFWAANPALHAQTVAHRGSYYDIAHEVTLTGTVSKVMERPARGMIMGSHLLLTTGYGVVDASLGRFGLVGRGALEPRTGQQIQVTGVVKTVNGRQVFLGRKVMSGGQTFILRNRFGVCVVPRDRERYSKLDEQQKGESQ